MNKLCVSSDSKTTKFYSHNHLRQKYDKIKWVGTLP